MRFYLLSFYSAHTVFLWIYTVWIKRDKYGPLPIIFQKFHSLPTKWTHLCRFAIDSTSEFHVESLWRFHRFWNVNSRGNYDVEISAWIRLSKTTKYRWVLLVDFSISFERRIDVTSVLVVTILSFLNIFCSWNLF